MKKAVKQFKSWSDQEKAFAAARSMTKPLLGLSPTEDPGPRHPTTIDDCFLAIDFCRVHVNAENKKDSFQIALMQ